MYSIIKYIKDNPEFWLHDFLLAGFISLFLFIIGICLILISWEFFVKYGMWRSF